MAEDTERPMAIGLAVSRRAPGQVEVRTGGRVVGTLTVASVTALGLRGGEACTPELIQRVEHRMALERAYKAAGDALARRALTSRALRERLLRRGFDELVVEEVLGALAREGLVNDAAVARELVRETVAHGGAGSPLLETKLASRGVAGDVAKRVIEEELRERNLADDALTLARQRLATLPSGLAPQAKLRRIYAYLARRGFDEEMCTTAAAQAVGAAHGAD